MSRKSGSQSVLSSGKRLRGSDVEVPAAQLADDEAAVRRLPVSAVLLVGVGVRAPLRTRALLAVVPLRAAVVPLRAGRDRAADAARQLGPPRPWRVRRKLRGGGSLPREN